MRKLYILWLLVLSIGSGTIIYSCGDDVLFKETQGEPQPPVAPIRLTISPDRRSAQISWFESPFEGTLSGGGTAAIIRYEISYSEQPDFSQETREIKEVTERSGETISFNLVGLDPNKTYYLRIRAYNNNTDPTRNVSDYREYNNGQGGSSFKTRSDATPPDAPNDLRFSNFGYDKFDITWSPPTDSGKRDDGKTSPITGYIVEWDTDPAFANVQRGSNPQVQSLTTNRLTVSLSPLKSDTGYYVRIYSVNDNNATDAIGAPLYISRNPLELSDDAIARGALPRTLSRETRPDAPTNVLAIPASITKTGFSVSFNTVQNFGYLADGTQALPNGSPNPVPYQIEYSQSSLFAGAITIPSSNSGVGLQGLEPGTAYYVRVRAVNNNTKDLTDPNSFRYSPWALIRGGLVTTLSGSEKPGAVTGIAVLGKTSTSATLSWNPPVQPNSNIENYGKNRQGQNANLQSFRIRVADNPNFNSPIVNSTSNRPPFTITNLQPYKDYYVEIVVFSDSNDPNNTESVPAYLLDSNNQSTTFQTLGAESPPGMPIDPRVVNTGQRSISLTWSPSQVSGYMQDGRSATLRGYRIYYSTIDFINNVGNSSDYSVYPPIVGATNSANTFITGNSVTFTTGEKVVNGQASPDPLVPNTRYYVAVVAVNNNPTENVSVIAKIINNTGSYTTTGSAEENPKAPVTPSAFVNPNNTSSSISFTWSRSPANNPDGLLPDGSAASFSGYELEISRDANFSNPTRITWNNTNTQYSFNQLSPNVRYYVRVRSLNNNPNVNYNASLWTQGVSADTSSAASKPSLAVDFREGQSPNSQNAVNVSWIAPLNAGTDASGTPSFINEYRVYYAEGPRGSAAPVFDPNTTTLPYKTFSGGVTSGTIDGDPATTGNVTPANSGLLSPGRSYFLWLVAVNNENLSSDAFVYNEQRKAIGQNQADTASAIERPSRVLNLDVRDGTQSTQARVTFGTPRNPGKNDQGVQATIIQYLLYYVDTSTIPPPAQRQPPTQTDREWFIDDLGKPAPTSQQRQPVSLTNRSELITITPNGRYLVGVIAVNNNPTPNNRSDVEVFQYDAPSDEIAPQPVSGNTFVLTPSTTAALANPMARSVGLEWQYDANTIGYGISGATGALANGVSFFLELSTDRQFGTLNANPIGSSFVNSLTDLREVVPYPANPTGVFTTARIVGNLDPDTTYYARIIVQNDNQTKKYSTYMTLGGNNTSFKTLSAATPPRYSIDNITITNIGADRFTVNYAAFIPGTNSRNQPAAIIGYEIEATDNKADFTTPGQPVPFTWKFNTGFPVVQGATVSLVFQPTNLANALNPRLKGGTDYYVRVRAINSNPNVNTTPPNPGRDNTSDYLYYVGGAGLGTDPNAAAPVRTTGAYTRPLPPETFTSNANALVTGLGSNPPSLEISLTSNTTSIIAPGIDSGGTVRRYVEYDIFVSESPNIATPLNPFPVTVPFAPGVVNQTIPIGVGNNDLKRGRTYYMWARLRNDDNVTTSPNNDHMYSLYTSLDFTNGQGTSQNFVTISNGATPPRPPGAIRIADMMPGGANTNNWIVLRVTDPLREGTPAKGGYGRTDNGDYAKISHFEITFYDVQLVAPRPNVYIAGGINPPRTLPPPVAVYRWPPQGQDLNIDDLNQAPGGVRNPNYPGTTEIPFDQMGLLNGNQVSLGNPYIIEVRAVNENYSAPPNRPVGESTSSSAPYITAVLGDKKPTGNIDITMVSAGAYDIFFRLGPLTNFDPGLNGGQPSNANAFVLIEVSTSPTFTNVVVSEDYSLGTTDPINQTYTELGTIQRIGTSFQKWLKPKTVYYLRARLINDNRAYGTDDNDPLTYQWRNSYYRTNLSDTTSNATNATGIPSNTAIETDDMVTYEVKYGIYLLPTATRDPKNDDNAGIQFYRKTLGTAPQAGELTLNGATGTSVTINTKTGVKTIDPNARVAISTRNIALEQAYRQPATYVYPTGQNTPLTIIGGGATTNNMYNYFGVCPASNTVGPDDIQYFTEITSLDFSAKEVEEVGVIINKLSGTGQKRDSRTFPGGTPAATFTLNPK